MAYEFLLPDIGEGLTEAEVVRWLVPVGSEVGNDQPLVEVETDKAVVEIPSPAAGVVLHHGAEEGEVLPVGQILAVIGEAGEAWSSGPDRPAADAPLVGTLDDVAEELPGRAAQAPDGLDADAVLALPLVRKLARERNVDLSSVVGSGPKGRITRADVLGAASGQVSAASSGPIAPREEVFASSDTGLLETDAGVAPELDDSDARAETESGPEEAPAPVAATIVFDEPTPSPGADRRVRMSKLRRTIAKRMEESWATVPHVTTFDEVDAGRLLDVRAALGRRHGRPIPLEALVLKAVLPALQAFPEFNATLDGDELILKAHYDIAVAVDTPEGLMTPVVHGAESMSLLALAGEIGRLALGASDRSLAPADLTGGTFTVSNIGAVGGGFGTPIVPPGTTAILSVGRAEAKPVVRDGAVTVAQLLPLSLSYDHRVIDGGLGRRFIAMVIENLDEPSLFLAS